ncbi:ABC transporter ATP-binding protein [Microbacterium betulae]|uniref:ABC transporter ATP-binding protein n=1 Tax=Microbacterium betulae TaxID=2981139 RepID=A0AA97FI98_9MICO|nr:ABC transporter ATP-binding protein [Microbacterium sp. AB]WOF23193.1 ABC transporter ATP-binding protein [Microbacterium sp. AB]
MSRRPPFETDRRPGEPVLRVEGLGVAYDTAAGTVDAVTGTSFEIGQGETVAVVGESGSGKSTTAHALIRLLPGNARITGGTAHFLGRDLVAASSAELRSVRGRLIGHVPQDPTVSLNPVMRIGEQVAEVLRLHGLADRKNAAHRAVDALARAGLTEPELRAQQYPHELSGGMRQRVLIAIAIVARPALIIADEPTSALDVTVQRQILDHLDTLKEELGTSLLLITHDLGVAADRADRVVVMSEGRDVEQGVPARTLADPQHPYTRRLIAAAPSLNAGRAPLIEVVDRPDETGREADDVATGGSGETPVLSVEHLVKDFALRRGAGSQGHVRAVDDVSFSLARGRTLALVGESGSGKTTTARIALRLADATSGRVLVDGEDVTRAGGRALRALRRRLQIVHQNPYASLNPRLTVAEAISDPLRALRIGSRAGRGARVAELLELVALPASAGPRKPAELSGGQRQRVAIARALAISPEIVVLDEPVSALDVSIQHQILTLLAGIQRELGVSYLFISHDLAVVRQIAHDVAVMRRGRIVEHGETGRVFSSPAADYTRALLDAIPGREAALPRPHP